jgi:hypothetical protein
MHDAMIQHRTTACVDPPDVLKHRPRSCAMSEGQRRDGRCAGDRIEVQIARLPGL